MAHTLFKLRSKVFNTPQLMNLTEFENVVQYLNDRCEGTVALEEPREDGDDFSNSRYVYNPDVQAAVINLEGPTTYKPSLWAALCGGFDYQTLKEDFTYLAEQGVKTVAFHMDSPGGEAHQMMDTASYLRAVANEFGIHLVGYADGMAASAGYGIMCICDEIYMSSDSEVGSIGVVVRLMNDSKALEKEGYQRTFITAGKSKVPFDKDGEFTEDFIDDLQTKVDTLYEDFTEHVATHRNLSVETVRSTEAKTFLPSAAIELGLADGVMTVEQFYAHLADVAQTMKGSEEKMFNRTKMFNKQEDDLEMTALAQAQEQIASLEASLVEAQAAVVELAQVKEQLTQMEEAAATTESALKEAQAQLEAVAQEKEQMKAEARKEKLAAVMSTEQVENVFQALAGLDDTAFEAVLQSYSLAAKAVEDGMMFQEVGGQGAVETQADATQEDTTTKLLKQRFAN